MDIKPCPFCGVIPTFYDGDYKIRHFDECFMHNPQIPVIWIVGNKRLERWNTRNATQ